MNEGLQYQYAKRRAFGWLAIAAFKGARAYLETHPAELMRRSDGTFRRFTTRGCYPVFYLTTRDAELCPKCAEDDLNDPVVHADVNWEDPEMYCEECSERIESAYAEKEGS